jgi:hypothetical protein
VNLVVGVLVLLVVTSLACVAMLLVRRRAPEGGYFSDGDRAAGVFGVLATGFSVLLGFIIFLAFSSYDASRSGAEAEATIVAQQLQTAQFLPPEVASRLTGELQCYARSVVGVEWDAVTAGTLGNSVNPWGVRMFQTAKTIDPKSPTEQSAYDRWMGQAADREQARLARVHTADGVIPSPVWIALFVVCGLIFVYVLFFADSGERAVSQLMLMGSVTGVITLLMLLLAFLNSPYGTGVGRLQPTAMERTIDLLETQISANVVSATTPPCDERGNPR